MHPLRESPVTPDATHAHTKRRVSFLPPFINFPNNRQLSFSSKDMQLLRLLVRMWATVCCLRFAAVWIQSVCKQLTMCLQGFSSLPSRECLPPSPCSHSLPITANTTLQWESLKQPWYLRLRSHSCHVRACACECVRCRGQKLMAGVFFSCLPPLNF